MPGAETAPLAGAVLIVLDTVRADRLSCYGHGRPTTPALDALAGRGVLFEQAFSYAPWTLPSIGALLSGTPREAFEPGALQLRRSAVSALRAAGLRTAAFTEGGFFSRHFGLDLGFEVFHEEEGAVRLQTGGALAVGEGGGGIERTFAQASAWLREHADERFFLVVHTYEAHAPYTRTTFVEGMERGALPETIGPDLYAAIESGAIPVGPVELEYLAAMYDGGIRECDQHVGRLLDLLDELGIEDDTLVVVTSDHGEELGERYPTLVAQHGHALYDDQVRVPLVLRDPRRADPGRRVADQVRTFDILPTVLDLLGVPPEPGVDGRSLRALLDGQDTRERAAFGGDTNRGPHRAYIRREGFKLIAAVGGRHSSPLEPEPPEVQLFELVRDPGELSDASATYPDVRARLSRLIGVHAGAPAELPAELDPALEERLRSLGYAR